MSPAVMWLAWTDPNPPELVGSIGWPMSFTSADATAASLPAGTIPNSSGIAMFAWLTGV